MAGETPARIPGHSPLLSTLDSRPTTRGRRAAPWASAFLLCGLGAILGGCFYDWGLDQLPTDHPDDARIDVRDDGSSTPDDGAADDGPPTDQVEDGGADDAAPPAAVECSTADAPGCVVFVPSGTFQMGAAGVAEPVHPVMLSSFYLHRYEVSVGQYRLCVQAGGCTAPPMGGACNWTPTAGTMERRPANCVTWAQADAYCAWWGGYLPTEAQWEFAARGPSGRTYPWGETTPTCALANHAPGGTPCLGRTIDVDDVSVRDGASAVGARQMAGNVWEWVADWYDAGYYDTCAAGCEDPLGPATGTERGIRGGGWDVDRPFVRSAVRSRGLPTTRIDDDLGFRCARSSL